MLLWDRRINKPLAKMEDTHMDDVTQVGDVKCADYTQGACGVVLVQSCVHPLLLGLQLQFAYVVCISLLLCSNMGSFVLFTYAGFTVSIFECLAGRHPDGVHVYIYVLFLYHCIATAVSLQIMKVSRLSCAVAYMILPTWFHLPMRKQYFTLHSHLRF